MRPEPHLCQICCLHVLPQSAGPRSTAPCPAAHLPSVPQPLRPRPAAGVPARPQRPPPRARRGRHRHGPLQAQHHRRWCACEPAQCLRIMKDGLRNGSAAAQACCKPSTSPAVQAPGPGRRTPGSTCTSGRWTSTWPCPAPAARRDPCVLWSPRKDMHHSIPRLWGPHGAAILPFLAVQPGAAGAAAVLADAQARCRCQRWTR